MVKFRIILAGLLLLCSSLAFADGLDANTKLLAHWNGTDAQQTYTTEDSGARTVTFVNQAQLDTAQQKFGTASLLCDGAGDYITVPDSDDWAFGTGNFTIDFWLRFSSIAQDASFYSQNFNGGNTIVWLWEQSTTNLRFICFSGGGSVLRFNASWSPSADTWYHVALVRAGTASTDWHIFINGSEITKTDVDGSYGGTIPNYAAVINSGGDTLWTSYLPGWIDEFRISNVARWTANFTPPASEYSSSLKHPVIVVD